MVKSVAVIGMGMGPGTLTEEALRAIGEAQVYFGAPRMLGMLPESEKKRFACYEAAQIGRILEAEDAQRFAVLVSGDPGFYSAACSLAQALAPHEVRVIPGISSLAYFFARLRLPWEKAELVSCHGRESRLADRVRRSPLTFALTGKNTRELGEELCLAGYSHLPVHVGEDLGTPSERIRMLRAGELARAQLSSLSVLLIENDEARQGVRFGIPDGEFVRGGLPMTKSLVRAAILSRLRIEADDLCYDVGAGTGSVSVEMALAAYRGTVYAVDREEESARLVRANARRFHIGNIRDITAEAPRALEELPAPDAAFIGGSGGRMREIFRLLLRKNPRVRLAVSAIALESLQEALACFQEHGLAHEVVQLSVSRAAQAGELRLMRAENPIWLLSGGGLE